MGKKVAVHVHGVEGMRFAVDAGIDTLEHCPFRAHGRIEYDERLVADMVARDLIVSLAMPATWYRLRAEEMREPRTHPGHLWKDRYETIRRMHDAGVKLVVSSDQGSTGTQIDELPLLMEFLTNQVQIPAAAVLRGVTGLAAEALGLADRGDAGAGETGRCGHRGWRPVRRHDSHTARPHGDQGRRDPGTRWCHALAHPAPRHARKGVIWLICQRTRSKVWGALWGSTLTNPCSLR